MEEELEKLYLDLLTNRQTYRSQKIVTVSPPQQNQNLINNPLEKNFIENSSGIFNLITKVELKDVSIMKTNSDDYNDWYYQRRKEYIHTHIHS